MTNALFIAASNALASCFLAYTNTVTLDPAGSVRADSIGIVELQNRGYMSNIVETVEITTNRTETSNSKGCQMCQEIVRGTEEGRTISMYHPPHGAPSYHPATEKTEITEVKEVKTLLFWWNGREYTNTQERTIDRTEKMLRLNRQWEIVP